jgi:hypothetical protein
MRSASLEGPRAHVTPTPARTSEPFNALTPHDYAMPRCAWESRPGTIPPTPWGRPSPPLYSTVRRGRCQPRDTMPPAFVRLTCRALEMGAAEHSNGGECFSMTTQDYAVTSGRWEQSSLSLSALCDHPRHCNATPDTATTSPTLLKRTGTGRRHARHCTSYGLPSTVPSSRPAGGDRTGNLYATTLEAAPVRAQDSPRRPNRSEIRRDDRQLRGAARHAVARRRIVRHTCKLLSPWPIKGGAVPQPRGAEKKEGDERRTLIRLSPFTPILALASISTSGTWRTSLLSCLACSTPLQAPRCNAIQCHEHIPAGRTTWAGTRINLVSPSCLAPAIEG